MVPERPKRPRLYSIGRLDTHWPLTPEPAVCIQSVSDHLFNASERHSHPAPAAFCHCGWNAFRLLGLARLTEFRMFGLQGSSVCGAVCGAGRVEVHRDGWRAERAQILCLYLTEGHPDRSLRRIWRSQRELAEAYGVPIWRGEREASEWLSEIDGLTSQPEELWAD